MNKTFIFVLSFGLSICATAVGAIGAPKDASTPDPAAIFHRYLEAENKGKIKTALGLVTNDVVLHGLGLCSRAPCVGKDAVRKEIERAEAAHTQHTRMDIKNTGERSARARIEHRNDISKAAGINRFVVITTVELRGDKIASFTRNLDTGDQQTQAFIDYQKAHASN